MKLAQLSAEAFELLKDKPIVPETLKVVRLMKPTRQVKAANLMVSTGNYSKSFAKALLVATSPTERVMMRRRPEYGLSREQKGNMHQELESVLNDVGVTESYGADVLSLVVASGYVSKLIGNKAIESYLCGSHPKILQGFRTIVAAVSLEESLVKRS